MLKIVLLKIYLPFRYSEILLYVKFNNSMFFLSIFLNPRMHFSFSGMILFLLMNKKILIKKTNKLK